MSVKSNLNNIKGEFQQDGKMLEGAFRVEILLRRYRRLIALIICVILGFFVWYGVSSYMEGKRVQEATKAYAKLLEDSRDEEALKVLKQVSPELHDLYLYVNAHGDMSKLEKLVLSKNEFVRTLAIYELASSKASSALEDKELQKNLTSYVADLEKVGEGPLKNLALLQEAYLYFLDSKPMEAHQKLMLIPSQVSSVLQSSVNMFKHYQPTQAKE